MGLFGVGCVTFSVYVGGLESSLLGFQSCISARCGGRISARSVSSPLGGSDLSLRHAAGDGFLLGLSPDLGGV